MDIFKLKKLGLFAGGVLFGTAGVKILGSEDAKKFYVNCVAAGLRARDCVMSSPLPIFRRTLRTSWLRQSRSTRLAAMRALVRRRISTRLLRQPRPHRRLRRQSSNSNSKNT